MNVRLEEHLAEGMRAYAAGLHLAGDVVGEAARRHRRRVTIRSLGYAAGAVALAGTLTAGLIMPAASPDRAAPGPAMLTVAQLSAKVDAALDETEETIEHVVIRVRHPRMSFDEEAWFDPTTGSMRRSGAATPGGLSREVWTTSDGDGSSVYFVDRSRRIWWSSTRPVKGGKEFSGHSPTTPDQVRAALAAGGTALTLVGPERLDGRATLHLRMMVDGGLGRDDLWVDAENYRVVRRVIVKSGDPTGEIRIQEDFQWLERTPQALDALTFTPPPSYREVPEPLVGTPAPPE